LGVREGEEGRGWGIGLTRISGMSPRDLTTEGSNVESKVLATAVKWVTEKRVLLNGHKTIVFN